MRIAAAMLLAAVAGSTLPVVALPPNQFLDDLNSAWSRLGEPRFQPAPGRGLQGVAACSRALCLRLAISAGAVEAMTLTGPAGDRAASGRYLAAQSLLVRLTAPGAPVLPALTADRIAVSGGGPAQAQLGPTCMRVRRSDAVELSTVFSRRPCSVDRAPDP